MRTKEMKMGGVNFTHVGGLEEHIKCLKEVVMFPLIYRDVYERFHIKPPRGVLFHGPPGTGKTLIAGALANECCQGDRQVSFYSRKGADCLNKWVGESEKKLRALFEKAQQTRPSIIFFDEIDGLAPVRSSRQDQVHSSVVSTLLALMDGLDTKSEIIVIGATNRIDAIDPALRRPGRFDRELYFPLPGLKARQDILNVHVKAWRDKPNESFINKLACSTVGYCGSDLQALCGEAVMCGLRRQYPDIYSTEHMVKVNAKTLKVETTDFLRAKVNIIPAAHRTLVPQVKRLPYAVRPLLQNVLKNVIGRLQVYSPLQFLHPNSSCKYLRGLTHCPRLLLTGSPLQGHTSHLAPAILHYLEHLPVHLLDVTTLHDGSTHSTEEACIQKMREARHNLPGILYLPDITTWWDLVGEQTRVVFLTLVGNIDSSVPLFILATANCSHSDLAAPLQEMFSDSYGQVISMVNPTKLEREEFFRPVFFIIPLLYQHNTAKENKVIGVKEIFVEPSEANLSTSGPVQLPSLQVDCSGASISPCRHLSRGQTFMPSRSIEHIGL
uniref:AAA+ ATPase domain-containing protein n=1 Tax=Timema cristinae TaxID=61476 RepID=A0A7R9CRZ2_TIMCR|nr:unnamed protein product [Timema cristinae]